MQQENRSEDRKDPSFIERARRAQIVEAAIDAIADLGYAQASLAQIAQRAGISKGVISYYFDGKEALIQQVVSEVFAAGGAFMQPLIEAEERAADRLAAYIRSNLNFMRSHRRQMLALIEIWANLRPKDGMASHIATLHEGSLCGLSQLLHHGQETGEFRTFSPHIMALVIRKAIDEVAYQVATQDDFDLGAYAAELTTLFDLATRK